MPTIRVDNQVMEELKQQAVRQGNVFGTPNYVMRSILGLGPVTRQSRQEEAPIPPHHVDIELGSMRGREEYNLIPIRKSVRRFFPGYKESFDLHTDTGVVNTCVTSAPRGTRVGDPDLGSYIQKGLRVWFDGHPELQDGAVIRIESLQPGREYRLSISHPGGQS